MSELRQRLIDEYGLEGEFCDISNKEILQIALFNSRMTYLDGIPQPILPYSFLYIGSIGSAYNLSSLKAAGITHILCLSDNIKLKYPNEFTYKRVSIIDRPEFDIESVWDECFDFIEQVRIKNEIYEIMHSSIDSINISGGTERSYNEKLQDEYPIKYKVLVHCYQGISRCASICCGYLIKFMNLTFEESLSLIRNARPKVSPNSGFISKLKVLGQYQQSSIVKDFDDSKEEKSFPIETFALV